MPRDNKRVNARSESKQSYTFQIRARCSTNETVSNGPPRIEQKTRAKYHWWGDNFSILSSVPSPSRRVEGATEGGEKKGGADGWCGGAGAKLKHWRGKLSAERGARGSDKVAIAYTDSEPGSVILIKTVVRKKRRAGSAFAWKIMLGTRINITLYCCLPTIDTNGRD